MSTRRIIVVITVCIIATFVLIAGIGGPAFFSQLVQTVPSSPDQEQSSLAAAASPVVDENAQAGTLDWQIAPAHESVYQIQAYAGATSVAPGSSIDFYVST